MKSDSSTAQPIGMPGLDLRSSGIDHAAAMIETMLRSMPRLMTISPIPRPRMPRMEMLRTRLSRLATEEKPGRVTLKTINSASVSSSTICSCDGFFSNCPSRPPTAPCSSSADASNAMATAPPRIYFSSFPGLSACLAFIVPRCRFRSKPEPTPRLVYVWSCTFSRRAPRPRDGQKFAGLMTPGRVSRAGRNQGATFAPLPLATGPNGKTAHRSKRLLASLLLPALSCRLFCGRPRDVRSAPPGKVKPRRTHLPHAPTCSEKWDMPLRNVK